MPEREQRDIAGEAQVIGAGSPPRHALRRSVRAGLSLFALAAVMHYVGWRDVVAHLGAIDTWAIVLAFACFVGEALTRVLNWAQLSRAADIPVRRLDMIRAYFMGGFVGLFLPSSLSTDAARCALAASSSGQRVESLAATSASLNLIGLGIGSVMALALAPLLLEEGVPIRAAGGVSLLIAGACCAVIALLWGTAQRHRLRALAAAQGAEAGLRGRLRRSVSRFAAAFLLLRGGNVSPARIAAVSALSYGLRILGWKTVLAGVGAPVSLVALLVLAPFMTVAATLPISVGGFGGLQAVHAYALAEAGATLEQAVAMSLVLASLYMLLSACGCVLYLLAPARSANAIAGAATNAGAKPHRFLRGGR